MGTGKKIFIGGLVGITAIVVGYYIFETQRIRKINQKVVSKQQAKNIIRQVANK